MELLTVKRLKEICKYKNIKGYSKLNKKDLIKFIKDYENIKNIKNSIDSAYWSYSDKFWEIRKIKHYDSEEYLIKMKIIKKIMNQTKNIKDKNKIKKIIDNLHKKSINKYEKHALLLLKIDISYYY